MKSTRYILFLILYFILFFISCHKTNSPKSFPKTINGILHLEHWDFAKDGTVNLDGEWEFYWNKLLKPKDCRLNQTCLKTHIPVPRHWMGWKIKEQTLEHKGYASYRLVVYLPEIKDLALKLNRIGTAYKLFVNGSLLSEIGKVSTDPKDAQAYFYPQVIDIPNSNEKELEILLQVSNYHHRRGGILERIIIGKKKQIASMREANLSMDLFLVGSLLIMGFYHFGLFILRKKNRLALYFGILCSSLALNSLMFGERYFYRLFSGFPYNWGVTLEFLTFNSAVPAFLLFISEVFPEEINKKIIKPILTSCVIVLSIILFFPPRLLTFVINISYIHIITVVIYAIYIMILASIHKREGAKIFLSGFIIFALFIVNDILYVTNIIRTAQLVPLGFFWFIFSQSFFLSMRFSSAFSTVEILSNDLEKQNRRLQQLDKLKDEFLSNTSHELRTPLNGIIGLAESLLDGIAGQPNSIAKNNLKLIVSSGKRLSSLVNDILDFSKLRNHELHLQLKPVDLQSLTEVVLTMSKPLILNKSLSLLNHIPSDVPLIFADENRLQQIMFNLIGNAIKFTEEGEVIVGIKNSKDPSIHNPKPSFLTVYVQDTGIGIPRERIDSIFQTFEQVDASIERKYGGTGLGLAVTRKLIELHGGKIWAESELGIGSTFYFTLPLTQNLDSNPRIDIEALRDRKPITESFVAVENGIDTEIIPLQRTAAEVRGSILVVDDEIVNLQVMENQLSLSGFRVYKASNGEDALRIIPEIQPDLILLDIMMPRISGYEVCQQLRKTYKPNELPIIFLSAKSQMEAVIHGFKKGGNDYMIKPFNKDELKQRVTTHIHLTRVFKMTNQFFPEEYLKFLSLSSILDIQLGKYIKKAMSIMFIDIRSYTSISEKMNVEENFIFINQFLKYINPAIRENEGL
ncbi:MAG: response regulator, partial [Leptospiraceae bacterium]|nr:response regulator [Leptospiraceae bacterium]